MMKHQGYKAPSSLCCQTVQLLVCTSFQPSALLILNPHLSPRSHVLQQQEPCTTQLWGHGRLHAYPT